MATAREDKIAGIDRALIHHVAKQNIRAWKLVPGSATKWNVTLHNGSDLLLTTVAAAHAFACGLASADQAATSRMEGVPAR